MPQTVVVLLCVLAVLAGGCGQRETSQQSTESGSKRPSTGQSPSGEVLPGRTWMESKTGMEFIWIAGGCFQMGSPLNEAGRNPADRMLHRVCVDGFWMGRHEVTRKQFEVFVAATDYRTDAEREGFSWVYTGAWEKRVGYDWRNPGFEQGDGHPVVHVSWNDATAMAHWLTEESSGEFRLPSEEEWEYACRAGSKTSRYWGDDPQAACDYANVADETARGRFAGWSVHACADGYVLTAPAGSFRPNGFALYDMLGNAWEWCAALAGSATGRAGADSLSSRTAYGGGVMRGGSWYSSPEFARCATREFLAAPERRSSDLGFRLIRRP